MTRQPGDRAAGLVMIRAYVAGRKAGRARQPITTCPYNPFAEGVAGAVERAQARMWIRGYDRENPMNIDYGD